MVSYSGIRSFLPIIGGRPKYPKSTQRALFTLLTVLERIGAITPILSRICLFIFAMTVVATTPNGADYSPKNTTKRRRAFHPTIMISSIFAWARQEKNGLKDLCMVRTIYQEGLSIYHSHLVVYIAFSNLIISHPSFFILSGPS